MSRISTVDKWCEDQVEAGFEILAIIVPLSWESVSRHFCKSFIEMIRPEIEDLMATKHKIKIRVMMNDTFPLCRNRNQSVEEAISSLKASYFLWIDADQVFPPDTIPSLFEALSNEFDCASGLYWRKTPPYNCVQGIYSPWTKDLEMKRKTLEEAGFIDSEGNQTLFHQFLRDFDTAKRIDVAGMGCFMMRANVFERLILPYFKYHNCYENGGDRTLQHASEEMEFHSQLKKKNIKTILVPSVRCGHIVSKIIGSPEQ